jgi:ERF superfamily
VEEQNKLAVVEPQQEMAMIRLAVEKGASIETVERLVALQEKMLARQAEIEFNEALNRVQSAIKRVAPDLDNSQTRSKYASYAAIDAVIRPEYSKEGFSLSFSEEDCPKPEHVRIVCFVSKGAYTRTYRKDMPCDGKGAKGGDVMTKTHAAAAADSYAKRYLVKDIFNVAIGEDDADGNVTMEEAADFLTLIKESRTLDELEKNYKDAIKEGLRRQSSGAIKVFMEARIEREKGLRA